MKVPLSSATLGEARASVLSELCLLCVQKLEASTGIEWQQWGLRH